MGKLPLALGMGVLVAPLLGYLFASGPESGVLSEKNHWIFPSFPLPIRAKVPEAELLRRYWPVEQHARAMERGESGRAAETHAWMLVAVIRQGAYSSALVMGPDKKLVSLSVGMSLDGDRNITNIETDQLSWENGKGEKGVLTLYPQPVVSRVITTKS